MTSAGLDACLVMICEKNATTSETTWLLISRTWFW